MPKGCVPRSVATAPKQVLAVLACADEMELAAFDLTGGDKLWQTEIGGALYDVSGLHAEAGRVMAVQTSAKYGDVLYAFDAATGDEEDRAFRERVGPAGPARVQGPRHSRPLGPPALHGVRTLVTPRAPRPHGVTVRPPGPKDGAGLGVTRDANPQKTADVQLNGPKHARQARRIDYTITSGGQDRTPAKGTRMDGVMVAGVDSKGVPFLVRINAVQGALTNGELNAFVESITVK